MKQRYIPPVKLTTAQQQAAVDAARKDRHAVAVVRTLERTHVVRNKFLRTGRVRPGRSVYSTARVMGV